jgi:hypothetical protein
MKFAVPLICTVLALAFGYLALRISDIKASASSLAILPYAVCLALLISAFNSARPR